MARQFTTGDVARRFGCDSSTVSRAANRFGIGDKHGWAWTFNEREVRRLLVVIHDRPGRPKKGRGR